MLLADIRRDPITGGEPTGGRHRRAAAAAAVHVDADVADPAECERLVRAAVERAGRLDVLVNNAALAGAPLQALLETEPDDLDAMMAVNLRGPFLLCRAAVRQMLTQPLVGDARGRIVNITSQHGMVGPPGHFAYAVGKGGLVQMTRQIAVDYGRDGIICNARRPRQDRHRHTGRSERRRGGPRHTSARGRRSRAWARAEDVAAAVAFLASDASYISGINLMVDGGWMAY